MEEEKKHNPKKKCKLSAAHTMKREVHAAIVKRKKTKISIV